MIKKEYKTIGPFKGWVLQNFPFIEADFDSITSYQLWCKIVEYINKVAYNDELLVDNIEELNTEFNKLYEYVNQYLVDVEDVKEAINLINTRLDELVLEINENKTNINLLNEKIDSEVSNLTTLINDNFTLLKNYVDNEVEILNNKIDNISIANLNIYDPTTGLISPLQIVINNIAQVSNKDGLTASEFDMLELSAQAFDNYQITAYEFDSQGKIILS